MTTTYGYQPLVYQRVNVTYSVQPKVLPLAHVVLCLQLSNQVYLPHVDYKTRNYTKVHW